MEITGEAIDNRWESVGFMSASQFSRAILTHFMNDTFLITYVLNYFYDTNHKAGFVQNWQIVGCTSKPTVENLTVFKIIYLYVNV